MALKTVGIKVLKNELSSFLREVKNGDIILVSDRNQIIAEIKSPSRFGQETSSVLEILAEEGKIILPKRKKSNCPKSLISKKEGLSLALLNEDREDS